MPSTFTRIDAPALSATPNTAVFTGNAQVASNILFAGTATNMDNANLADHYLNIAIKNSSNTVTKRFNKIPVPYGSAIDMPKLVVGPGEVLQAWCDVAGMIDLGYEVVQRT